MGRIIRRVLLGIVIAAGIAVGVVFFTKYTSLKNDLTDRENAAAAELAAAQEARDAVDRSLGGEAAAEWDAWTESVLQENRSRLASLQDANSELDSSIAETQAQLEAALQDEDTAYYMTVYESLKEGMTKVEEHLP